MSAPNFLLPGRPPSQASRQIPLDELPEEMEGPPPDAAFIRSVERFGVQQPVVVVAKGRSWQLLDGRKRVFAARAAGMAAVPAVVNSLDGWGAPEVLTLASELRKTNLQAQARAVEALIAAGGDEKSVQAASGLPRARVKRLFALAALEPRLKSGFYSDAIKPAVAAAAAALGPQAQAQLASDFEQEGVLTPARVRRVAEDLKVAALLGPDGEPAGGEGEEEGEGGGSEGTEAAQDGATAPGVRRAEAARMGRRMLELLAPDGTVAAKIRHRLEEVVAELEA